MNSTQKAIVEATIDIVAEKGLDGFSIREIAKKLDISHTNIYAYYKTKEELLRDCFHIVNKEIAGVFDDLNIPETADEGTIIELFHQYWLKYIKFMIDNGNRTLFYYAYRDSDDLPHVFMRNDEITANDMQHFMTEFKKLSIKLNVSDIGDINLLWVFLLDGTGAFVKHILRGHVKYNDSDVEKVWKLMLGGLSSIVK